MKTITSTSNQEIKEVAALSDNKERLRQGRFVAEGVRTCTTLLSSSLQPIQLYCTEKALPSLQRSNPTLAEHLITIVADSVMKKISQSSTPSGIVGVFQLPEQPPLSVLAPGLVLARISDPGNMGTLIRTCAALALRTVVIIEGVDPWNSKVVQASAGTIAQVDIFRLSWEDLLLSKKDNLKLCALTVTGGKKPRELTLTDSLLVVGNEAEGIPNAWIAACEQKLTLPMPGNTESLNAAVAGSIALYWSLLGQD